MVYMVKLEAGTSIFYFPNMAPEMTASIIKQTNKSLLWWVFIMKVIRSNIAAEISLMPSKSMVRVDWN